MRSVKRLWKSILSFFWEPMGTTPAIAHHWIVCRQSKTQGRIIVRCSVCGAFGTINDATPEEYTDAQFARRYPYPWDHPQRVSPFKNLPCHHAAW